MVETQLKPLKDHPPLLVCNRHHVPHMYRATGNCRVMFYVECSVCQVQTQRFDTAQLAADAWTARRVHPIVGIADHAVAFA